MEEFGPVQIMVVGFDGTSFNGEILPELQRLKELDIVRLVDLVVVAKDMEGDIVSVELSDLSDDERMQFGAIAGALIGLGAEAAEDGILGDEAAWSIADTIPMGTTAAVALLEHRWAIPLRDAIRRAGGVSLADSWIHPEDLIAIGAVAASDEA